MTVSIGVTDSDQIEESATVSVEGLMETVERALYRAKARWALRRFNRENGCMTERAI